MLADFKMNRCTRRCHTLARPLRDGEWYYSVVFDKDEELVRRDYSAEAWIAPPENSLGWWKSRMPQAGPRKLVLAPDAVLVELLRGLGDAAERRPLRYLLALTLLRRRTVTQVGTDSEASKITVRVHADGGDLEITTCAIERGQIEPLQAALQELMYCEASE